MRISRSRVGLAVPALIALLAVPAAAQEEAEQPERPERPEQPVHHLQVTAGLGLVAAASADGSGSGSGVLGEVEYIYRAVEWVTPRAYAGVLLTSPKADCGLGVSPCDVSADILYAGGKLRLMAPIPYVGPFLESGLGLSIGRFSTRSGPALDVVTDGFAYHVPFGLGLAFGSRHQYEVSFQYLFHPAQKQFGGGIAVGFAFPLR